LKWGQQRKKIAAPVTPKPKPKPKRLRGDDPSVAFHLSDSVDGSEDEDDFKRDLPDHWAEFVVRRIGDDEETEWVPELDLVNELELILEVETLRAERARAKSSGSDRVYGVPRGRLRPPTFSKRK
jgi:hypothetical protein